MEEREEGANEKNVVDLLELFKHLRVKYSANNAENDSEEDNRDHLEETKTGDKDVWGVFDKLTGGKGRCTLCLSSVSYQDTEMKRHLKARHPKKYSQMYGEETLNESDQEDLFKDVIYLEEPFSSTPTANTSKSTTKRTVERRYSTKPKLSPPREQTIIKNPKKSQQEEEIEKFATYITFLLKSVTPEQCSKLQMEIINLIMKEKLKKPEVSQIQVPKYLIHHGTNGEVIVKTGNTDSTMSEVSNAGGATDQEMCYENDVENGK